MKPAYIIDAVRSPIGRYGGKLSTVRPDDLLALMIRSLVQRNGTIDVHQIEDVIVGAANQAGEDNRNVGRLAALLAGLPVTVAGNTVNRLCGSGMQAIMDAAKSIMCGEGMLYIAGGVEIMSRAPFITARQINNEPAETVDSTIGWRFTNPRLATMYHPYSMGETAEQLAIERQISRAAQDVYAANSHAKYFTALANIIWEDEIIPVPIIHKGANILFDTDEHPRLTSVEKLAGLKPAFVRNGCITAGNASGINDGASALLLASEEAVKLFNLQPMARVVSTAVGGVHPEMMGLGPVPATQKALQRASLKINDIDLVELNEAFAVQSIACIDDLALDANLVNVNGGAIALGNPLGSGGARITTTLLHEMKRRKSKYGLAAMCIGVGQGSALIVEAL
ncbi:thiolase family protein [Parasediminibacterium paludis]|uniref:Thiolase family protein n=1 Tax=Parasediminibacterium paludis TaxID=908966 RepID=A0ABV8PTV1_9BACT